MDSLEAAGSGRPTAELSQREPSPSLFGGGIFDGGAPSLRQNQSTAAQSMGEPNSRGLLDRSQRAKDEPTYLLG